MRFIQEYCTRAIVIPQQRGRVALVAHGLHDLEHRGSPPAHHGHEPTRRRLDCSSVRREVPQPQERIERGLGHPASPRVDGANNSSTDTFLVMMPCFIAWPI